MKKNWIRWPESWTKSRKVFHGGLLYSQRDFIVSGGLFLLTVVLCMLLRSVDPHGDTSYVAVLFFLDVFLTALLTDGYLFSILIAVAGVLCVDYIFTEPYWEISFTLAGFPLTFIVMMFISVVTGMLTSRAKQLDALKREAERERIHANLLRAVSHDIRTPLTGIVGATDVLLEQGETLTPQQRHDLTASANEDARWLIRIVENLLSITRIGARGDAKVTKTDAVAEEVIGCAAAKFSAHNHTLPVHVHLPPEVLLVPMDELLMEQVLLNLLENAALHAQGATEVNITLENAGKWARILVEDNGAGIPREELPYLFDASAHQSQQGDKKRNMGIGLSVCKTVVEAHGGTIRGENASPRGGARFVIELPMEDDDRENQG